MHVSGKIAAWLVAVLIIVAVVFASKAFAVRDAWMQQAQKNEDNRGKDTDGLEPRENADHRGRPTHDGDGEQEGELAAVRLGVVLKDVSAGDIGGHQVGSELHALEREVQDLGDCADQQCLGQARNADQKAVAPSKDGRQDLLDNFGLADDDTANLLEQEGTRLTELG